MIIPTLLDFYVYGWPFFCLFLLGKAMQMYKYLDKRKIREFIMENYYT